MFAFSSSLDEELDYDTSFSSQAMYACFVLPFFSLYDGNQVEDAQAHEAQAQQGAQVQRITRSMARALGQEYNKMALLISFVE